MTFRKQLAITTALLALMPFAAHAVTWTGTTSNAWELGSNWGGTAPTSSTPATINNSNLNNNPVQVNNATDATTTLTLGAGTAPGQANSLNFNLNDKLTATSVILAGGTITATGVGTLGILSTNSISGFGTVSAPITGTSFTANSTNGTPQVPGTALTLVNQSLASDTFNISSTGTFTLNGDTISGTTAFNGVSTNLTGNGNNKYGLYTVTGSPSTLGGTVTMNNYPTVSVTGTTLHLNALNWSTSNGSGVPSSFNIGVGGVVDNGASASTINGQQPLTMSGGTLSNTGGGTFTVHGLITGFGNVTGPINLDTTGGFTASGGTLVVDSTTGAVVTGTTSWQSTLGATLDLKNGAFTYNLSEMNPGGGTIQLDSATINTTGGSGIIGSGAGQFTANSGVNTINGAFNKNTSNSTVPNVTVNTGATLTLANTGVSNPQSIWSKNFTMQTGAVLNAGPNNGINVAGSFFFQQIDTVNAWTYGGTKGLGPDLVMTGGSMATPVTLEVGGVNEGNVAGGFVDNFALHSLALGTGGYVDLVDQNVNATPSGWVSGVEALYVDGLIGVLPVGNGNNVPTLNLGGLFAYDLTCPTGEAECKTFLMNGLYTDANGGEINVIGAPMVPEPATLLLFGTGLAGLGLIRRRRT